MSRPVLPYARAAIFATVCTCLGVLGHAGMSQAPVPAWAIAAGFGGVLFLARLMAAKEASLVAITGLMAATQAGLHLLFNAAQQVGGRVSMAPMPGMRPTAMAVGPSMPMRMTAGMFAAHAVAALVCAWWLRVGEARLHRWARRAAAWLIRRFVLIVSDVAPARPSHVGVRRQEAAAGPQLIRFTVVRRGPPQRLCFA